MQLRSTRTYAEHSTSVHHTLQLPALSTGNVGWDIFVQVYIVMCVCHDV
jgi:hypothetical protein